MPSPPSLAKPTVYRLLATVDCFSYFPHPVPHLLRDEEPEAEGAEELDRVREAEHALKREPVVTRQLPRDDEERRERAERGEGTRPSRQQIVDGEERRRQRVDQMVLPGERRHQKRHQ